MGMVKGFFGSMNKLVNPNPIHFFQQVGSS